MTRDRNNPSHSENLAGNPVGTAPHTGPIGSHDQNIAAKPQGKPARAPQARPAPLPAAKPAQNPTSLLARQVPEPQASAARPPASPVMATPVKRPVSPPSHAPAPGPGVHKPAAPMARPVSAPVSKPAATPATPAPAPGPSQAGRVALPLPKSLAGAAHKPQMGQPQRARTSTAQARPASTPPPKPAPAPTIGLSEPSENNSQSAHQSTSSVPPRPAAPSPANQQNPAAPNQGLASDPLTSTAQQSPRRRKAAPQQPELERQYLPTGMPRPRASLHEKSKAPSIGGLIHSMQAEPSKAPYYTAVITSVIWLFIGGLLGWLLVGQSLNDFTGYKSVLGTSSVYILAAAVLVPIALFWFIAQLVVRSQEMKLMASAMTEVAIRLAEPDKMAEQKVASVGQTIRRQVSAMDDAISRAIGRAGELEALVHNEVAALERSYSQNEFIIRNLLNELVNEREAIAHNGIQVKQTLQGVGAQVSKHIRLATDDIGKNLAQHGTMSALKLQQAGDQVTKAIQTTTEQTVAIKQKISTELPQLLNKMNAEQVKLGNVIDGANRNLGQLDTTLAKRTTALDHQLTARTSEIDGMIAKHSGELNTKLVQKVKALDASLAMRTKSMDKVLSAKAGELDQTFLTHREAIDTTMQQKAVEIDEAIATQAQAMDASLTQKARTIDAAFDQRLASLEESAPVDQHPVEQTPTSNRDLSMLRGSEALERAMHDQTKNLQADLDNNRGNLDQTIGKQNQLSPKITLMTKKHDQLLHDHDDQVALVRDQFAAQSGDLLATARLLTSPDMKMSAMMGPQQNKARAILGDLVSRSQELEKSRLAHTQALQNSLMLTDETADILKKQLAGNASPRALKAAQDVDHGTAQSVFNTQKLIREMETNATAASQQVVETVTSMSRSSNRTKVLPGDIANTSTDIRKAVDMQMQALDALAQISGTNISSGLASATGTGSASGPSTMGRSVHGQGMLGQNIVGQGQLPSGNNMGAMPPAVPNAKDRLTPGGKRPSQWSFGDLLARVADTDSEHEEQPLPTYRPSSNANSGNGPVPGNASGRKSNLSLDPLDILRVDDIARALDSHTAALAWNRSQAGERNVFTRGLYTSEGQATFDQISERYAADNSFRNTVEKYVIDFEGLLKEADEKDPSGRIIQNYLTTDAGRAYLMLAHITGRLG